MLSKIRQRHIIMPPHPTYTHTIEKLGQVKHLEVMWIQLCLVLGVCLLQQAPEYSRFGSRVPCWLQEQKEGIDMGRGQRGWSLGWKKGGNMFWDRQYIRTEITGVKELNSLRLPQVGESVCASPGGLRGLEEMQGCQSEAYPWQMT